MRLDFSSLRSSQLKPPYLQNKNRTPCALCNLVLQNIHLIYYICAYNNGGSPLNNNTANQMSSSLPSPSGLLSPHKPHMYMPPHSESPRYLRSHEDHQRGDNDHRGGAGHRNADPDEERPERGRHSARCVLCGVSRSSRRLSFITLLFTLRLTPHASTQSKPLSPPPATPSPRSRTPPAPLWTMRSARRPPSPIRPASRRSPRGPRRSTVSTAPFPAAARPCTRSARRSARAPPRRGSHRSRVPDRC